MKCEREKSRMSKVFGLSNQKDEVHLLRALTYRRSSLGKFLFILTITCPLEFKYIVGNWICNSEVQRSGLGCLYKFVSHRCATDYFKDIRL